MSRPLLAFIGPSGAGKSAIVRSLAERGVVCVHPTWTTRPRRHDEAAGSVEHRFVSEDEFRRRRDAAFFLHTVQMFGMPHWYGLPAIQWNERGVTDAVMLRAALVPMLRAAYSDLVIYQIDAPVELLEARLAVRDYTTEELDARLADNERELVAGLRIARRTFRNNGLLDEVIDDVERAIREDFASTPLEAI